MSVRYDQRPRLVVLNPRSPVLESGRAIENNNIGAVVVHDRGEVVGIVTDCDLAVSVVGRGLDPTATLLADVMTSPVAVFSPRDSQHDAVRLMQERNVRRIPLVEGERLVGTVTLDDLFLDEAAPLDGPAHIVATQIGEGGPADSVRSPAGVRRAARAQATYRRLLNQLRTHAARRQRLRRRSRSRSFFIRWCGGLRPMKPRISSRSFPHSCKPRCLRCRPVSTNASVDRRSKPSWFNGSTWIRRARRSSWHRYGPQSLRASAPAR